MKQTAYSNRKTIVCYFIETFILFICGGLAYIFIEKTFRGYSHISMFLLGGIDFVIIGTLNEQKENKKNILIQTLYGAVIITISELITGYIVNIRLKLNVWDYSDLPFNLFGQISLYYSLLWIPLSAAAIILDDLLRLWRLVKKLRNTL